MRAVIVYESMFGNTRQIADAIGEGLTHRIDTSVINVNLVRPLDLTSADLLVTGGPTHVHGMSRPTTRAEAEKWPHDPLKKLTLDPGALGIGIREWLDDPTTEIKPVFAAFATRADMPVFLSGNAAAQIDHVLHRSSSHRLTDAENFRVTKDNLLHDGELERARAWGILLGEAMSTSHPQPGTPPAAAAATGPKT